MGSGHVLDLQHSVQSCCYPRKPVHRDRATLRRSTTRSRTQGHPFVWRCAFNCNTTQRELIAAIYFHDDAVGLRSQWDNGHHKGHTMSASLKDRVWSTRSAMREAWEVVGHNESAAAALAGCVMTMLLAQLAQAYMAPSFCD